jgi:hypothetical protein
MQGSEKVLCDSARITRNFEVPHFHKKLQGEDLCTDNSALTWLLNLKNLEGQAVRWVQCFQEKVYNRITFGARTYQSRPCPEECAHCQKIERQAGSPNV